MDLFIPVEFETNTTKKDVITYKPTLESYNYNDRIKITVNSSSFTELYNSYIYLRLKIKTVPTAAANKRMAFVTNGIMHLFSEVILDLNGVTLEHVKQPGMCHLLMNMLIQDAEDARSSSEYAFNTFSVKEDDTFDVTIPLENFLNFAHDYKKFLIYSRFDLTLVRARNDYNTLLCGEVTTAEDKAEIDIEKLYWRIPQITVNDVLKLKILKSLDNGKEIYLPFRSVEYHEFTNIPISSYLDWSVKSSIKRPLYAVAAFQTNKYYNLTTNNSKFEHLDVRNIRLSVNATNYPFEQVNLDFTRNCYAEAYKSYLDMRRNSLENRRGAMMTKSEFSENYPIFCFNLSNYDFQIKDSVIDLKLSCEFHKNPPANTNIILILLYENLYSYNAITNVVNKEI